MFTTLCPLTASVSRTGWRVRCLGAGGGGALRVLAAHPMGAVPGDGPAAERIKIATADRTRVIVDRDEASTRWPGWLQFPAKRFQRNLRLKLRSKPASHAARLHSSGRPWNSPKRPERFSGATIDASDRFEQMGKCDVVVLESNAR